MDSRFLIRGVCSQRFWTIRKAVFCCLVILIICGLCYKQVSLFLDKAIAKPILLEVPLNYFPLEVGGWSGSNVEIPPEILKVAQNDDFLNRFYINQQNRISANLYIAFSARPRTMLGHRPTVCYKGAGWNHELTEQKVLKTNAGLDLPCLVHKFSFGDKVIYVLNYYILNGQLTINESSFAGISMRMPNIDGKLAKYVAQVQISSEFQISVEQAAVDFADIILEFFPDQNGLIRSDKYLTE